MTQLDQHDKKELRIARENLYALTELDPDMTVKQAIVLIEVALNSGDILASEIGDRVDMTGPSVTRCLDLWGFEGFEPKSPREMIRRDPDPSDRRFKILSLTPKGADFLKKATDKRRKRGTIEAAD